MSEILILHDAVPGRIRLRIEPMRRSPSRARVIEDRVRETPGVFSAAASAVTGSVLVLFDPALTAVGSVLAAAREAMNPWPPVSEPAEPSHLPDHPKTPASPSLPRPVPTAMMERLRSATARVAGRSPQPLDLWHTLPLGEVAKRLATNPERGLSAGQAARRTSRYGPNEIPDIPRRARSVILIDQLASVPMLMLSAAAALSVLSGAMTDALFIGGAIAANAALGYFTEDYAERSIQSLRQVRTPHARVLREGRRTKIPIEDVVPGDLLLLEPGHIAAADGRVVRAENLLVDESLLTGESAAQAKETTALTGDNTHLGDRRNMVYAGSAVVSGKGAALVTATGLSTELGRIRTLVEQTPDTPPPMTRDLQRLGGTLALLTTGVCAGFGVLGYVMGIPAIEVVAVTASLAVSAIPEGLPTVATTTLALGMRRLRRLNVVIRKLPAVAALGSATVLCVDKTGTLTENRMTVRCFLLDDMETETAEVCEGGPIRCIRRGEVILPPEEPLLLSALEVGALCTEADLLRLPTGEWDATGSSTEQALLLTAVYAGVDVPRLRAELNVKELQERAAGRNYMATVHQRLDGGCEVMVKGAPEEVLALCSTEQTPTGTRELTPHRQNQLLQWNERLASRGLRVLGLARGSLSPGERWEGGPLSWIGLVGLEDPVRQSAGEAIRQLYGAGIRTIMLTGDQRVTAAAVGHQVGLGNGNGVRVAEGAAVLEQLSGGEGLPDVLARISPDHKFEIVRQLQARGDVVMMTGDGVNDAPALKAADVGVAMGVRSTQVARDLADMILLDDNLAAIPAAVSQGRTIFSNTRKALRFMLASNLSDIGLVAASVVLKLPLPLTALQLLWMNLVTDVFPALALAMEPAEPDVMQQPPRPPKEPILPPALWRIIGRESLIIAGATFGSYLWALGRYGAGSRARTVAFSTITMGEIVYAAACRSERPGVRSKNPYLAACLATSAALQVTTVIFPPLRALLGLTALSAVDWIAVAAGSGAIVGLAETMKRLPAAENSREGDKETRRQGDSGEVVEWGAGTTAEPVNEMVIQS